MPEERLLKMVYTYELDEEKRGIDNWVKKVKVYLQSLGLAHFWDGQNVLRISKAKFKKVIAERIRDQRIAAQLAESRDLSSCSQYIKEKPGPGIEEALLSCNQNQARKVVRFALGSAGALVCWNSGISFCAECNEEIRENVFTHRVRQCSKFLSQREKYLSDSDTGEFFLWNHIYYTASGLVKKIHSIPLATSVHALFSRWNSLLQ